jgi:aspartate aminotransferase
VQLPVPDVDDFAAYMLDKFSYNGKTTFVAPAAGFYMQSIQGRQQARIAYVLNKNDIEEAIAVLAAGIETYSRK